MFVKLCKNLSVHVLEFIGVLALEQVVVNDELLFRSTPPGDQCLRLERRILLEAAPRHLVNRALILADAELDLAVAAVADSVDDGVLELGHDVSIIVLPLDMDHNLIARHVRCRQSDRVDTTDSDLPIHDVVVTYAQLSDNLLTSFIGDIVHILLSDHQYSSLRNSVFINFDQLARQFDCFWL